VLDSTDLAIEWYNGIILPLAAAIVYSDKVLLWISDKTQVVYGWRTLIIYEMSAVGLMVLAMFWLMPICANLSWSDPLIWAGILGAMRSGFRMAVQFLNLDD
jgi:hypothetical protein